LKETQVRQQLKRAKSLVVAHSIRIHFCNLYMRQPVQARVD